ncbi:MAG: CaiB/BaiF CoA-transferase family protein [Gammaproteobacteria bacterium]
MLKGVRVLDLTRLLPGPLCTQHLADLGAEVIKVEDTKQGDYGRLGLGTGSEDDPGYFDLVNRGKRSVSVDLKHPEGREFFLRLVRGADAVVESFRPGVMERLGLGHNALRAVNPALVYCSLTGYGASGPLAQQAGHDLNYCGYTGLIDQTGHSGEPPVIPAFQIADLAGGTLTATTALLAGLFKARVSGEGTLLDVAMTDSVMAHSVLNLAMYRHRHAVPPRGGGVLNGGAPCYGLYQTGDGRWMAVAALEKKFWERLCLALERPDLIGKHNVSGEEAEAVRAELQALFQTRSAEAWLSLLTPADCCVSPVLTIEEALQHPQFREREVVVAGADSGANGVAFTFPARVDGNSCVAERSSPELGEATDHYLQACHYSAEEIRRMKEAGIVKSS